MQREPWEPGKRNVREDRKGPPLARGDESPQTEATEALEWGEQGRPTLLHSFHQLIVSSKV